MSESSSNELINTIKNSNLPDISIDILEVAFDSLLNDGVVRELPVIGSIVKLYRGTISIRDQVTIRRILVFLSGLSSISEGERAKLIQTRFKNKEEKVKTGEYLLSALDQVDDIEKAILLSKLFKMFLLEILNLVEFRQCSKIVRNTDVDSLKIFYFFEAPVGGFGEEQKIDSVTLNELTSSGLVRVTAFDGTFAGLGIDDGLRDFCERDYATTSLGRLILSLDLFSSEG